MLIPAGNCKTLFVEKKLQASLKLKKHSAIFMPKIKNFKGHETVAQNLTDQ